MDISSHSNNKVYNTKRFKDRGTDWVCAVGRHKEVWDYSLIGSFERCFDLVWGVLQVELGWHRRQLISKLRKNKEYVGKFAELRKIPKQIRLCSEAMEVGVSNPVVLFDRPQEVDLGLSKSIYALLNPNFSDLVFSHDLFGNPQEEETILNQLANWENLHFLGEKYDPSNGINTTNSLRLSNYPLVITSSVYIAAKAYQEGLICCFVPSLIYLTGSWEKNQEKGILKEVYKWLAPCPKRIYIIEEKLKIFGREDYYTEIGDYSNCLRSVLQQLELLSYDLGCYVKYWEIDKKTSSREIVKMIKEEEKLFA